MDGCKFYTTGALFADWIHLSAQDEDGEPVVAVVPTSAPGVTIEDDWDGLDRYWRNARTLVSHDPRLYRERSVGQFAISGTRPPREYRVGTA